MNRLGAELRSPRVIAWSLAALAMTAVALIPVMFPEWVRVPPTPGSALALALHGVVNLIPVAMLAACMRAPLGLKKFDQAMLLLLLVLLALLLTNLHHSEVDDGHYFSAMSNTQFQQNLAAAVVRLDPAAIPHSYRFLPDSLVALVQYATGIYTAARDGCRAVFLFLLMFTIYRFSRRYLSHPAALVPVLLYAIVFPISIRHYAGQMTDPVSHLSIAMGLLFIESGSFIFLLLTLLIGILAKESILIVIPCYALVRWKEPDYWLNLGLLTVGGGGVAWLVRRIVVGAVQYERISGVGSDWWKPNLASTGWEEQVLYTVGILLPFTALAWKGTPHNLKLLVLILLPGLLVSNAMFSWMHEARNLIPAVIPMAVMTARYFFPASAPASDPHA